MLIFAHSVSSVPAVAYPIALERLVFQGAINAAEAAFDHAIPILTSAHREALIRPIQTVLPPVAFVALEDLIAI